MLTVYHSTSHLFSPVNFSFSALHQLEWLTHLQQSPVPLQFPLPDVVIATDATAPHWAFYFQGSGLPLSVSGSWLGSMCRSHIALQELQAITMMLHRMDFYLSGKLVALHLDNSSAKVICVIKVLQCLLLLPDWPSSLLSLTWQAQYYSNSSIYSYPPQCRGWLSALASFTSRMASSPSDGSSNILPLGSTRGGSAGILLYHSIPALLHLGNSTTSGGLGVEYLQPSLDISGKLCVSSSCIRSSSSVQVPSRTC